MRMKPHVYRNRLSKEKRKPMYKVWKGCGTLSIVIVPRTLSSNRPIESNFKAFQNLVSEHSVEGVPASLYNLTKSVQDPYNTCL